MVAERLDYRDRFLSLLHNREKKREQGFVVFVHGSLDLAPLEELCFGPEQTYNRCFTARYGAAGPGDILTPLVRNFLADASETLIPGSLLHSKVLSDTVQYANERSILGVLRPTDPEGNWPGILREMIGLSSQASEISVSAFFSFFQRMLEIGDRLVLFCEVSDLPDDAHLQEIGFDEEMLRLLSSQLPERMGLVFSGIPNGLGIPDLGERFLDITVGADYGTQGKSPEQSQRLENDSSRGEDQLAIASEVNALADAIMDKEMDPPLVVGILGGWGAGKSFILQLLQKRLRFLRNRDLSKEEVWKSYPYVGHPYMVRFDAWTYAKSDLWASLMEKILFDLDQQLDLEQAVAPKYEIKKGFDLWEILENTTESQLYALEKDLGQEAVARIKDWKQGGNTAKALWGALETLRKDELSKLREAEQELLTRKKELDQDLQITQENKDRALLQARQQAERDVAEKHQEYKNKLARNKAEREAVDARITLEVDRELEKTARQEAWLPLRAEVESFLGASIDQLLSNNAVQSDGAPISIWEVGKEIGSVKKYMMGLWKSPASLAFLSFALVSGILTAYLVQTRTASLISSLASYTGLIGGLLASGYTALTKVNHWFEQKQTAYEEKMKAVREEKRPSRESLIAARKEAELVPVEAEIQNIQNDYASAIKALEETKNEELKQQRVKAEKALEEKKIDNEATIECLRKAVEEHRRRAGIPGQSRSLTELIQKRIESGYYQQRLGILHQVQKDLQEITDALLPIEGYDEKLFPRGKPRIILMIDDLDRCPPKQVVQMLEAAQLLVKTRLFVVVIAMDVRFVTRALEKEYEGILVHEGNPSGLDYAEKIVQIPYRVRPIAPEAMASYLRSQMVIRNESAPASANTAGGLDGKSPATITAPGHATTRVNDALPPQIEQFEPEEFQLLQAAANSVEITPRATKRLVNVMKLIKNIWYRKSLPVPAREVEQAMILLLTLSACYPETMARIFDGLERSFRDAVTFDPTLKLCTALQPIIQRWCGQEGLTEDWAAVSRLIQNQDLLDPGLTLDGLGLNNLKLVRTFSFLGEVETPPVEKPQRHAVELTSLNAKPMDES